MRLRSSSLEWSVGAVVVVVMVDAIIRQNDLNIFALGVLDEMAHIGTAAIFAIAIGLHTHPALLIGSILGAVLIDVDHIPLYLGANIVPDGTGRPFTHSLVSPVIVFFSSLVLSEWVRRFAWAAVGGLLTHLLRDSATGGVPLWWPIRTSNVTIPYTIYLATLFLQLAIIVRSPR